MKEIINNKVIPPQVTEAESPTFLYSKPLLRKPCKLADRVRSLCYNERTQEIAIVSLNGFIHCWNAVSMRQVKGLPVLNLLQAGRPRTLAQLQRAFASDCPFLSE
jgi:hypothetical protein